MVLFSSDNIDLLNKIKILLKNYDSIYLISLCKIEYVHISMGRQTVSNWMLNTGTQGPQYSFWTWLKAMPWKFSTLPGVPPILIVLRIKLSLFI